MSLRVGLSALSFASFHFAKGYRLYPSRKTKRSIVIFSFNYLPLTCFLSQFINISIFKFKKMQYAKNILETIGNTPLVKLNKVTAEIDALVS